MLEVHINFRQKPRNLDEILKPYHAFKRKGEEKWVWKDQIFGDVAIELHESLIRKSLSRRNKKNISSYVLKVYTRDRSHLAEERMNEIAFVLKNYYEGHYQNFRWV